MMSRESFLLFYKKLNTSIKNIERWINQLKNEEKIEFRGSHKTRGYILKETKFQLFGLIPVCHEFRKENIN